MRSVESRPFSLGRAAIRGGGALVLTVISSLGIVLEAKAGGPPPTSTPTGVSITSEGGKTIVNVYPSNPAQPTVEPTPAAAPPKKEPTPLSKEEKRLEDARKEADRLSTEKQAAQQERNNGRTRDQIAQIEGSKDDYVPIPYDKYKQNLRAEYDAGYQVGHDVGYGEGISASSAVSKTAPVAAPPPTIEAPKGLFGLDLEAEAVGAGIGAGVVVVVGGATYVITARHYHWPPF